MKRLLLAAGQLAPCAALSWLPACGTESQDASAEAGDGGDHWNEDAARIGVDSSDGGELEVLPIMYTAPELPVELLQDGDSIELWRAPQGGHVLLVGARVRNLESDTIELRVRVRHPDNGAIYAEEMRTVVMESVADDPAWMQTDRRTQSQVTHVAVCPDYDLSNIVDEEWTVEVEVTELYADFSFGRAARRLRPTCMQEDATQRDLCLCECAADYVLGKCG